MGGCTPSDEGPAEACACSSRPARGSASATGTAAARGRGEEAAPDERAALLRAMAEDPRGALEQVAAQHLLRDGQAQAHDLQATLTEPDRDKDFTSPGRVCRPLGGLEGLPGRAAPHRLRGLGRRLGRPPQGPRRGTRCCRPCCTART